MADPVGVSVWMKSGNGISYRRIVVIVLFEDCFDSFSYFGAVV